MISRVASVQRASPALPESHALTLALVRDVATLAGGGKASRVKAVLASVPALVNREAWLSFLEQHRLLGYLPLVLPKAVAEEPWAERARREASQWRVILAERRMGLLFLSEVLARKGIRFALLKGIYLAQTVYLKLGHRVMGDLDVLVDSDRRLDAIRALRAAGIQPYVSPYRFRWHAKLRSLALPDSEIASSEIGRASLVRGPFEVDLHWEPAYDWGAFRPTLKNHLLWKGARSLREIRGAWLPDPVVSAVFLAVHALTSPSLKLAPLVDLLALLRQFKISPAALRSHALIRDVSGPERYHALVGLTEELQQGEELSPVSRELFDEIAAGAKKRMPAPSDDWRSPFEYAQKSWSFLSWSKRLIFLLGFLIPDRRFHAYKGFARPRRILCFYRDHVLAAIRLFVRFSR